MPDARTERWAEHRAAERRRIVDVAKDAIEDIGPQLTMNEIAARACVPKPALYRFFVDKSELMQAVAERARDDVVAELFRLSDTTPETLGDLLGAALSGYASLIQTYPNLSRYLFFGVENAGAYTAENSRTVAHLIEPLLTATIAPGQPDHDVALLASMVVGAVTGAAAWWLESPDGLEVAGSGICANLHDYARLGLFALNGGVIDGESVVPEGWFTEATEPRMAGSDPLNYGYMWWPVPDRDGDFKEGAFSARGIFGQYIYVNPSRGIVLTVLSCRSKPKFSEAILDNDFFNAAVDALS